MGKFDKTLVPKAYKEYKKEFDNYSTLMRGLEDQARRKGTGLWATAWKTK